MRKTIFQRKQPKLHRDVTFSHEIKGLVERTSHGASEFVGEPTPPKMLRAIRAVLGAARVVPPRPGSSPASIIRIGCTTVNAVDSPPETAELAFHGVWLRDNCTCATCLDHATLQRQVRVTVHSSYCLRPSVPPPLPLHSSSDPHTYPTSPPPLLLLIH